MSYQKFLSKVKNYGDAVKADIGDLQIGWDDLISLGGDFKNPLETIYDCYPYLFKSLFPNVKGEQLRQLSIAGRLFGASIVLYDEFLDNEILDKNARKLFSPLVMQWESQKILSRLFEPDSLFWKRFDGFYREHIRACAAEESFRCGKRCWSEFGEDLGLEIAVGKNGISRAVAAGLVELSGGESIYHSLIEAIDNFNIACQILDDLVDWKQDLKDFAPSLLLTRVFNENPHLFEDENAPDTNDFAKIIYYRGYARRHLTIGIEAVEKSLNLLNQIGGEKTDWHTLVVMTGRKIEGLLEDFDAIVRQNKRRVETQLKVRLEIPAPNNDFETIAHTALNFVIEQWRKGFGEARHIMNLTAAEGFSTDGKSQYRYADVFQRALILETLCDVRNKSNLELEPIIDYEIDYLLEARRRDEVGGWAYFPNVEEIAADADDLGQIIQALVCADRKELALSYCEKPLKILLKNNLLDDGSVETWIVPKDNRTEKQEIQHRYNLNKWGVGPDAEVVANLFYSLFLYDPERFGTLIKKAAAYLESVQNADGSWNSRWYYGSFYGTYVCARLIGGVAPDSPSLKAAARFLTKNQNTDGGWGRGKSEQLSTALALLGLASCDAAEEEQEKALSAANREPVFSAVEYLKKSVETSDDWDAVDFIQPRFGEPYKSRTITAMYVCKAASTWRHKFFND